MSHYLRSTTLKVLALCALAAGPLVLTNTAQAGTYCAPQPTVTRCITVRSPECPGICATVNVCLPACVAHLEPCVSSRPTLFGKGVVHLSWRGGPTVSVRFSNHGPRVFYH